MRKLVTRTRVIILLIAMALCLTGCGENNKTIRIITWTNDGTIAALNELNQKFFEETGINVEVVHVPSDEYEELLLKSIEDNSADIFCYTSDSKAFAQPVVDWAPSELLTWEKIIKEGKALDLSNYSFVNNWDTGARACEYNDGIYGIATGMTIMNGIFYNKKMFEDYGWSEPETWDEFVRLCENIEDEGIEPLTAGGAAAWPVQMLTNAIVDSVEEDECALLSEGLWKGARKYTDDKSMEIYNREYTILSYMEDGYLEVEYENAPSRLANGMVAMLYAGSWNAADIEAANPDFDYGYFAIPGNTRNSFTGKYDLTLGVNSNSDNIDSAVSWMYFFSEPENYTVYINKNGFVPTMSKIETSNRFLKLLGDGISDADRTFECYNRVPDEPGYGTYDLINFSIAGGVFDTPEEFAAAAQEDWDKAIK